MASQKVLIFLSIVFLMSCQNKEKPLSQKQSLAKGFSLIDQGHYDGAIDYFSQLLQKDSHPHVQIALASAYAARAGIKFEQLYAFIVERKVQPFSVSLSELPIEQQTIELIENLAKYTDHWSRVPVVQGERYIDLYSALSTIGSSSEPGVRLYAAGLRVVLLKSTIHEGAENFRKLLISQLCADQLYLYIEWTVRIIDGLIAFGEDLLVAFPENEQQYNDVIDELSGVKEKLDIVLRQRPPSGQPCF